MSVASAATASGQSFRYRVKGMDCPSCAAKIETALKRLPGVLGSRVSYASESLTVELAPAGASTRQVAESVEKLGFKASLVEESAEAGAGTAEPGFWQQTKTRTVIGLGIAMAVAFASSYASPAVERWLFIAVALVGIIPVARQAFLLARAGSPFSIEMLMTVATAGALAIDAAEEAAVVVFLFQVGELLERVAAGSARAGIRALVNLVPRTALVQIGSKTREMAVESLAVGHVVVVRPGDRIPADGTIIEGTSAVDMSPITGESAPVDRQSGDDVLAGTISISGALKVRVSKIARDNTIARIIHLVEEAQATKAPMARFIDRFSAWYTPAAMGLAALVAVIPPVTFGAAWDVWIYRALSLLLIACPCALVLSTPAAIASGISAAARRGLLLKGGAALETLAAVKIVAFDKTGTLTAGQPRVTAVAPLGAHASRVIALAAAVEQGSSHPLAKAIVAKAQADTIEVPNAIQSEAVAGKGVRATVDGISVLVASPRYASELTDLKPETRSAIEDLESQGNTVVVVIADRTPLGVIALRDEPRPDAAEAVTALRGLGIRPLMLTGDNRRTGEAIAFDLGIDVQAELLPADKLAGIEKLKTAGRVAMVGDGINDAPALAAASVGIAMGGGTDVALETADAALLKNRVFGVAELIGLARATLANVRQNIAFSLGLKAMFLATSVLGITTLWMAILADTGATVVVTMNALRLLRWSKTTESV